MISFFFLCLLLRFSLFIVVFRNLVVMCQVQFSLYVSCLGLFELLGSINFYLYMYIHIFRKVLNIILLKLFFCLSSFILFPLGTQFMCVRLILFHESQELFYFSQYFFFLCLSLYSFNYSVLRFSNLLFCSIQSAVKPIQ